MNNHQFSQLNNKDNKNIETPSNHKGADDVVTRAIRALKRNYIVVGKKQVHVWKIGVFVGLAAGLVSGVILVANRSGEVEKTSAAIIVDTKTILTGINMTYAPSVLEVQGVKRMWLGGWLNESDACFGTAPCPDKMYFSEFTNGSWSRPVKIKWTNGFPDGEKPGFHINDPSVIKHPVHDWLFMYYTALPNEFFEVHNSTRHNVTGFASSIDGGRTWTDHGIVIPQDNGFIQNGKPANTGAWAPSAIVRGNEIWVYYHENAPGTSVLRTRLNLNGWQRIQTEKVNFVAQSMVCVDRSDRCFFCSTLNICQDVRFEMRWFNTGFQGVNVDVSWQDPWLVMLTNDNNTHTISRFISTDGINWHVHPQDRNPIMDGGVDFLYTPHAETIDWNRSRIYYGFGTSAKPNSDTIRVTEIKSF